MSWLDDKHNEDIMTKRTTGSSPSARSVWSVSVAALALTGALGLSGCNTVQGMGEDIASLGGGIESTAQDAQTTTPEEREQMDLEQRETYNP